MIQRSYPGAEKSLDINAPKRQFSDALGRVAGDSELLAAMAMFVVEDSQEVIDELQTHLQCHEMTQAAASAHKLKGMLSTFETAGPVIDLHELIVAAKENNTEECARIWKRCRIEIESLVVEISSLRQT